MSRAAGTADEVFEHGSLTLAQDGLMTRRPRRLPGELIVLDPTSRTLQYALDGLSLRQQVSADNVANQGTPGFQAHAVDFESTLVQAVQGGTTPATPPAVLPTSDPSAADGNNVNLGDQLVGMQTSTLQYRIVSESLNAKFQLMRDSETGSF